jgi:hypothetical protein
VKDQHDTSLDIDAAIEAIRVQKQEGGPRTPDNPLGRLIPDRPDPIQPPSVKAALARMRTARISQLRSIFLRKHVND